jgi:hypothetical protein
VPGLSAVLGKAQKANGPGAPFGWYQGRRRSAATMPVLRKQARAMASQLTLRQQSKAGLVIARQKFVFLGHRRAPPNRNAVCPASLIPARRALWAPLAARVACGLVRLTSHGRGRLWGRSIKPGTPSGPASFESCAACASREAPRPYDHPVTARWDEAACWGAKPTAAPARHVAASSPPLADISRGVATSVIRDPAGH